MAEPLDPNLTNTTLYKERRKRADADKPPPRSNPLGAIAHVRAPKTKSREEMADAILAQDNGLIPGLLTKSFYEPFSIEGLELKLEPIQPSIGTIIHGIDLNRDLSNPKVVNFLRTLWLDRKVVVFRNQGHLSQEDLVAFANYFGEVGAPFGEREHVPNSPHDLNQQVKVPNIPDMLVIPSDEIVPNAASGWHADATWQARPPMGSILICREAPPIGGDTCFCDCHGMWEGLPKETKHKVEKLTAIHMGTIGHQMDGVTPVATHPVARTHPETGKTTLYVQQGFVRGFAKEHQISNEEEKELLLAMKFQEGKPEYTCRVRWEVGSLAMWDNRSVLHSASGDFWPHRRLMERLTILDRNVERRTPYYKPSNYAD